MAKRYVFICDVCKSETSWPTNSEKPPKWSEVHVKTRPPERSQLSDAKHSVLICDDCSMKLGSMLCIDIEEYEVD